MPKTAKTIAILLFVAVYLVAASGIALEGAAQLYSTGAQTAIAFHAGGAKDLPVPSLTQPSSTPPASPVGVPSVGCVEATIIHPAEEPQRVTPPEETLPSYRAELPPSISDRAPPTA